MKKVLITGANSYIGTSFERFIKKSYDNEFVVDTIDMLDSAWKDKDFSKYDCIFHVAGIAHSDSGKISKDKEELYYSVNTYLAIDVARKAKNEGVNQFIYMSSAIVYGNSSPIGENKVITKHTPVSPANCYGDSKVQAEIGLMELNDTNFKIVILRPPMIYGKESKGNYPLLAKIALYLPVFPYVSNQRSMLYIDNLCEFVRLMIKNNEKGIFWPQNNEYSNTSELVQMIAQCHSKKLILVRGFEWILKIAGRKIAIINKAFGNLCYEQEMSKYRENYQIFNIKKSIEETEK